MSDKKIWLKFGEWFLTKNKAVVSPAQWHAATMLSSLAQDMGLAKEAKTLSNLAEALEGLAGVHGIQEKGVIPERVFRRKNIVIRSCAHALAEKSFTHEKKTELGMFCVFPSEKELNERVKAIETACPTEWMEPDWIIEYARVSKLRLTKSLDGAVEASQARALVDAAFDASAMASNFDAVSEAVKVLSGMARKEKWGDRANMALALVGFTLKTWGKTAGLPALGSKIDYIGEQGRFAPQSAFVGFFPKTDRQDEGFWGSTNQNGMDLGGAKMFESERRARQYFDRMGRNSYAIVEVSVAIKQVICHVGDAKPQGLNEEVARAEAEQINKAIEGASIELLRKRLSQLEAGQGEMRTAEDGYAQKRKNRL